MDNQKCDCDCDQLEEELDEETPCCGDTNKESAVEGCECGCGGEFEDESLVNNPENPEKIANDKFFQELEKFAHLMGIVSIGYTTIDLESITNSEILNYRHAIVLTMEMSEELIKAEPGPEAQTMNESTYSKLAKITYALSDFIRTQGFATQVAHPYGGLVNLSPLGMEAGLGWIGKNGLLITPELGPRIKISAIFTSIENLPNKNLSDHSWISEYCLVCGKCMKACPEKALIEVESCCEESKIELIQSKCIGCNQGCTYCIKECPFYKKGYGHTKKKFDKIRAKLSRK